MTHPEFPDYGETATRIQRGRRSRFRHVQTPQWTLLMQALSDPGYRVYSLLLAHANQEAGDGVVWPSQEALAEALGKSEKTISRIITTELKPLGLVDVETYRYGQNNTRRGNVYTIHEEPPAGWHGQASVVEFHAVRKAAQEAARKAANVDNQSVPAGQAGDPKVGASGGPKNAASGHPKSAAVTRRTGNYTKHEGAPSGRVSALDARRASTGSGARASRGGSAASAKTSTLKPENGGQRRLSRQQAEAIRVVEAGFPEALQGLLPSYRPPVLRDAILESLRDRTADQLAQRVARRWLTHGYAEAFFGGKGIASPVGVAVALVRAPADCPDLSCEDGVIMGSGEPCRACRVRKADRRSPGASTEPTGHQDVGSVPVPGQAALPSAAKWWCMAGCGFNSYRAEPADHLCNECRAAVGGVFVPDEEDVSIRQTLEAVLLGGEAVR